jgi:hypothetical protein
MVYIHRNKGYVSIYHKNECMQYVGKESEVSDEKLNYLRRKWKKQLKEKSSG